MDPRGKVALVTGGAGGIGLAICRKLLEAGAKGVSVCDINQTNGEKVVQELGGQFGDDHVIFIRCDVTNGEEFESAFEKTNNTFHGLDIVVNNAGIFNDKNWELQVDVNVSGVIRGLIYASKYMSKDKGGQGGAVINMASVAGLCPPKGIPIYASTKFAVVGLTRSFGEPLFYKNTHLRVMAMCPGVTETDILVDGDFLLDPNWKSTVKGMRHGSHVQKPDCVADGVLLMIREGRNRSIWFSFDGKPAMEITYPKWQELNGLEDHYEQGVQHNV